MIRLKICLLGATAVGKTSLTRRFVEGVFSDRYLTTVGVRIDKRVLDIDGEDVHLVVWDLSGEDEFAQLQLRYLRGASGWIAVADGTRPDTLDRALDLHSRAEAELGARPAVLLLNKADLADDWRISEDRVASLTVGGGVPVRTSAKTGEGVEAAFEKLARAALKKQA